ncbi:MAG: hypothetical protein HY094_02645 [Candidatus Melainabacteria bacterium]|nr:hypothetical protein [Candidatus Melainabacteria bacterium]
MPIKNLFNGEMTSNEVIDSAFSLLENQALDRNEILINFQNLVFVSVYFLEKLESFIEKAKKLNVKVQIKNVPPSIYKVFRVARVNEILKLCF